MHAAYLIQMSGIFCLLLGCDEPDHPSLQRHREIEKKIDSLGGKARYISEQDVREYDLPMHFEGAVGAIYADGLDLTKHDIDDLIPKESLIIGEFNGTSLTDEQARMLAGCDQLRLLYLDSTFITDESLKTLADLPTLQQIALSRCNVTDKGLKELHRCRGLTNIWLMDTHVTHAGVEALKDALPEIDVEWVTVPSKKIRQALAELDRSGAYVNGVTEKWRMKLKDDLEYPLHRFHIMTTDEWEPNATHAELLSIVASKGPLKLTLKNDDKEFLKEIGTVSSIHELVIVDMPELQDGDLQPLSRLDHVGKLSLGSVHVTSIGLKHLSEIDSLGYLVISQLSLDASGIVALAKCRKLTTLELYECDLGGHSLDVLASCPSLQEINLNECRNVAPSSIESLRKKHPRLVVNIDGKVSRKQE